MSEWIEWNGGKCPVDGKTVVEARLRGGEITAAKSARSFGWENEYLSFDIVAYRVIEEAKPEPVKMEKTWERDYTLLRRFDLEAAKAGEPICNGDEIPIRWVGRSGNGELNIIERKISVAGNIVEYFEDSWLRMAPLCWVEGKPVYKGDVLWHKAMGQEVTAMSPADSLHIFAEFELDGATTTAIDSLAWQKPKVKHEGWGIACVGSLLKTREEAEARIAQWKGSTVADGFGDAPRVVRIEWEA